MCPPWGEAQPCCSCWELELWPHAAAAPDSAVPAVHALVSVQHLLPQLLGLDPAGELEVCELLSQQLRSQERLQEGAEGSAAAPGEQGPAQHHP